MKIKILFLCVLAIFNVGAKSQDIQLKSFRIASVGFGITTPMSISCSDFDSAFPDKIYATQDIDDSIHVSQLKHMLSRVGFEIKGDRTINVRAKIYLEYATLRSSSVLCIDKFYRMELDGRMIKRNKRLIDFVRQFLKSSEY